MKIEKKYLDEMKDIDITLPIECVIYDEDIITCKFPNDL